MFEDMTYENILADMLSRVTDDVDKREGSIIYDALAPCAYELAQVYFSLNNFIDLVSADTAVGEYLDREVQTAGITRKQATYAIRKIETTGIVDIGTRWGIENIYYTITEKITDTTYKAICSETGTIGNIHSGQLENMDNVPNVEATLTDVIESGADVESDESLRGRFYTQIQRPATSGNANHYKHWALEVEGVGEAKVFPLANGPGTVKVLILDNNMDIDRTLEDKVFKHIESIRPVGANVTVESPIIKEINVKVKIVIDSKKYTLIQVQNSIEDNLRRYLKEATFKSDYISYASIGNVIFNTEGVIDYSNFLLNDANANIILEDEEIPILNSLSLEV